MQNKKLIGIIIVLIIIVGAAFTFMKKGGAPVTNPSGENSAPLESTNPQPEAPADTISTPTSGTPKANEYTLIQIATHNSKSNCWTTVNGSVYNVTSWIPNHPGGEQAIMEICGKDATKAFSTQHSGQKIPVTQLATFKIGTLKK